jgi:hypothetical protein
MEGKDAFDLAIKITGVIGAAFAWLYQWHIFRFRSKLKDDLDILKSYKDLSFQDRSFEILKANIDRTIIKAYSGDGQDGSAKFYKLDWILGGFFLLISIIWTWYSIQYYPNENGFTAWWRVLIAVFFAFTGLGAFWNAYEKKRVKECLACQNQEALSVGILINDTTKDEKIVSEVEHAQQFLQPERESVANNSPSTH